MNDILWRRLRYMLSPQWDLYEAIAPKLAGQSVLEIGCGTGFGALQFLPYAKSVHATDIDQEAVDFCQRSWPLPGLTFGQYDICATHDGPPDIRQYGAVVMIEVLEHVSNRGRALAAACAHLPRGGTMYVSARNALADLRRNELHEDEKTAAEFLIELGHFFRSVSLYDYSLTQRLTDTSHVTPTVAVCKK